MVRGGHGVKRGRGIVSVGDVGDCASRGLALGRKKGVV